MLVLGLTVVQRGAGFVREVLFCRWLPEEELGIWSLAFTFLFAAGAIVNFGIGGSLSRYLAYYRRRGQLRSYLRRVAAASGGLALVGGVCIWTTRAAISEFIFGEPSRTGLVTLLAVGVVIVVAGNFVIELFTALRLFRVVSLLQLVNSLGFISASVVSMLAWRADAIGVVTAFSAAYAGTALVATTVLWHLRGRFAPDDRTLAHRSFWPKLLRLGAALWTYNCLVNVFLATDRVMLVHCSGMSESQALEEVGNYHSARVVPLLLASLAGVVASTLIPHLSHDWESGKRRQVARRVSLAVKLIGIGLLAAGAAVLVAAPLVFDVAFAGRFAGGRAVLPWVLSIAIWYGLSGVVFNYLWCAERLLLASGTLGSALGLNIVLNALLIPKYGLRGAVLATAASQAIHLVLLGVAARRHGWKFDTGVCLVAVAPAVLPLGAWAAAAVVALLLLGSVASEAVFDSHERRQIGHGCEQLWQRVVGLRSRAASS
jgi:O-antigen/teichoic acid export membrane protein